MMILNNERVADEIYASIKKDILCKKYKIGDTIEVQHLAALFGVSSNIAEQALRLLSQRGLLTQLPDDMYCVKETHSQEFFLFRSLPNHVFEYGIHYPAHKRDECADCETAALYTSGRDESKS